RSRSSKELSARMVATSSRAARQPGPHWNIGRDPQLERRYLGTTILEDPHPTADIAPEISQFASVELRHSAERCAVDFVPVGAEPRFDHDLPQDNGRQHKALIVVGMIAHQIDAAGRLGDDDRVFAECFRKAGAGVHSRTLRSVAAAASGAISLAKTPAPNSVPARNLSLSGARRIGQISILTLHSG